MSATIRGVADPAVGGELERLSARVARERRARHEAEAIAERATGDLYERQRELELLGAVATAANSAADVDEALAVAVERVCEHRMAGGSRVLRRRSRRGRAALERDLAHG